MTNAEKLTEMACEFGWTQAVVSAAAPMFTTHYTAYDGPIRTDLSVAWVELSDARRLAVHLCSDRNVSGVHITDANGATVAIWARPGAVAVFPGGTGSAELLRASGGAVEALETGGAETL